MVGLDRHLDRWVVEHRAEPFDTLFVWLSRIGSNGLVWIAISFVVAIVWRRYAVFGMTLVAVLVADTSNFALKNAFDRQRPSSRYSEPEPLMQPPPTHSLPSGHAATSFACATVIGASAPRLRVPLYALAALIAWSRVYVGVHYPLDVIAGALWGLAVGLVLVKALPRLVELLLRSLRARPQG